MSVKTIFRIIIFASVVILAGGAMPGSADSTRSGSLSPSVAPSLYHTGSEVQISTPSSPIDADRYQPAVAYNYVRKQNLVVWHNTWPGGGRDIYAQRVSNGGERVGSWFAISAGAKDRSNPAVAYNATNDEYLVVWMYEASPDVYEIWGRIVAWNGSYMKSEFRIMKWANRSFWTPCVAWNSFRNEYMVVWNAFDTTTSFPPGLPHDIAGYRISSNGVVQNPGSPLILTTYAYPHQVDMTYNATMDQYFLVFVVVFTEATSGNDIYGLRVSWNGSPVGGLIEIYKDDIAGQRKHQNHPAVATNEQDKYMVVWDHLYATFPADDHDIYGREYNADGSPDGSYFTISSWTQDDTAPDIAANGATKDWMAVWQRALPLGSGYSIHGLRWGSAGSSASTYLVEFANWTFIEAKTPAVAGNNSGYFVVYEEVIPPAKQHIYGRMWWPEALYVPLVFGKDT